MGDPCPYTGSDFARTVERLGQVFGAYGEIVKVRSIPAARAGHAMHLRVSADNYGRTDPQISAAMKKGAAMLAALVESEREEGRAEMKTRLRAIADELERTRAILPQLAAAMAVQLGAIARDLRDEAK
ncbi:MAG: hypothetical protein Q8M31_21895 [Beijerinckiaceae bacterium]|nr:hypothetical protein [Beijerinckiaceae bacterium]